MVRGSPWEIGEEPQVGIPQPAWGVKKSGTFFGIDGSYMKCFLTLQHRISYSRTTPDVLFATRRRLLLGKEPMVQFCSSTSTATRRLIDVLCWLLSCAVQLMLEGKAAGDHHEGTIDDPELLMEVREVTRRALMAVGFMAGAPPYIVRCGPQLGLRARGVGRGGWGGGLASHRATCAACSHLFDLW
jgi:hypothetical protein